jgi:flagellar motor switch protein FliG
VPFGFLKKVSPESLLTVVAEERSQTIALILSHLPAPLSAAVVAKLPSKKQLDVVRRIATMEQPREEVVRDVERGIEARMRLALMPQSESAGGISAVAQMLNVSNRLTNKSIFEYLEQEDPELVDQIRRRMFVFDDLMRLDESALQSLLKDIEPAQWALALKGASEELKSKIVGSLSHRASNTLLEEIQCLGPVRVSDVETAQQQVLRAVRRLEDAEEFSIAAGDPERMVA